MVSIVVAVVVGVVVAIFGAIGGTMLVAERHTRAARRANPALNSPRMAAWRHEREYRDSHWSFLDYEPEQWRDPNAVSDRSPAASDARTRGARVAGALEPPSTESAHRERDVPD